MTRHTVIGGQLHAQASDVDASLEQNLYVRMEVFVKLARTFSLLIYCLYSTLYY